MNKKKVMLSVMASLCLLGSEAMANIDNLSNLSAEWMRTGNRNAATDAADIVVYNPAGLTALGDGFHLNIGNQAIVRRPEHSFNLGGGEETYEQDGNDLLLPNLYGSWNKGKMAIWGGFYIPGGGAVVDYPDGSVTTSMIASGFAGETVPGMPGATFGAARSQKLEAESAYKTLTLGASYDLGRLSVAGGVRYMDVDNSIEASIDLNVMAGVNVVGSTPFEVDVEQEATGHGFIFGLNLDVTDRINIAAQYMTEVELDFDSKVRKDDLAAAGIDVGLGSDFQRDFPAVLGLGIGWEVNDRLYLEANTSYWYQKSANWGEYLDPETGQAKDVSDMAGDASSWGLTGTWKFSDAFKASVGAVYTDFHWNDRDGYYAANIGSYEVLYTDNWQVSTGFVWQIRPKVGLNFSVARTIWDDATLQRPLVDGSGNFLGDLPVETENKSWIIGTSVNIDF